jgi:hemerythrin
MQHLEWSQDWDMGEPTLDRQHKSMVTAFNRVVDALNTDGIISVATLRLAISFLLVYMTTHKHYEEKLMKDLGYPELSSHTKLHELCIEKIEKVLHFQKINDKRAGEFLVEFFNYWITDHLNVADYKFSQFLKTKNISEPQTSLKS